jgi:hypothetical protein
VPRIVGCGAVGNCPDAGITVAGVSAGPDSPRADARGARPPGPVRAAAALVGLQGLVAVGFAGYLVVRAGTGSQGLGGVVAESGMFLLIGAALLLVALGLAKGRFWARTPAVVVQLLLLPLAYSLLVPSHQVLAGAVTGAVVLAALLLLLSAPARAWALDQDDARRGQSS